MKQRRCDTGVINKGYPNDRHNLSHISDMRYCSIKKLIFENIIFITLINNFDMQKHQGVSPPIGRRDMYYSSLDSSRQGASNSGRFMSLASLDRKLFAFFF